LKTLRVPALWLILCSPALAQLQTAAQIRGNHLPKGVLVLTFDDGPDENGPLGANQTISIAALLNSQPKPITGTFFLNPCHFKGADAPVAQSSNCRSPFFNEMPASFIDSMLALHQSIGNHGQNHVAGTALADAGVFYEFHHAQSFLGSYQKGMRLLRPAGFTWNTRIADALNSHPGTRGLTGPIYADFIGSGFAAGTWVQGDWDCFGQGYDAKTCGDLYVNAIRRADHGGIVLIHDRSPMMIGSDKVLEMVRYILSQLQDVTYLPLEVSLTGRKVPSIVQQSAEFGTADGSGDVVFGNITGNYKATPCKMRARGVWCMEYNHHGFNPPKRWFAFSRQFALRAGQQFWLADLEGSGNAGLVWEEPKGLMFAPSDGVRCFRNPRLVLPYSAADGWRMSPGYALRFGDFDRTGSEGLLVRGWFGLKVYTFDGAQLALRNSSPQFTDGLGWALPQHVLSVGDIDGDGIADVCGRDEYGVVCSRITPSGISPAAVWTAASTDFTDREGWSGDPAAYSSFTLADIFGQGLKVPAGRKGSEVVFTATDSARFLDYRHLVDNFPLELAPLQDWQSAPVYFADLDGDGQEEPVWMLPTGLYAGLTQIVLEVPRQQ
jgi:Polysaccharide deacetylase